MCQMPGKFSVENVAIKAIKAVIDVAVYDHNRLIDAVCGVLRED